MTENSCGISISAAFEWITTDIDEDSDITLCPLARPTSDK